MKKIFILYILILAVSACSSKDKEETAAEIPAEELYNQGLNQFSEKNYKSSIESFQKIEQNYPFSKWATKGQVMAAYSAYKRGDYDDAINILDGFIKIHPGNDDIAYAYYLKALCYYERIVDVGRDQAITEDAMQSLKEVMVKFPETEYGRDAKLKIDLVLDHLAGKEMEIGRFYLKEGKYIRAINRFKVVIDKYQTTSHIEEALYRLVESYLLLGVKDEAQKYAAVLGNNYTASKWYKRSYELLGDKEPVVNEVKKESWFKRNLSF